MRTLEDKTVYAHTGRRVIWEEGGRRHRRAADTPAFGLKPWEADTLKLSEDPQVHRQGPRCRQPVYDPSRARGGDVRRREDQHSSLGPDPADPADAPVRSSGGRVTTKATESTDRRPRRARRARPVGQLLNPQDAGHPPMAPPSSTIHVPLHNRRRAPGLNLWTTTTVPPAHAGHVPKSHRGRYGQPSEPCADANDCGSSAHTPPAKTHQFDRSSWHRRARLRRLRRYSRFSVSKGARCICHHRSDQMRSLIWLKLPRLTARRSFCEFAIRVHSWRHLHRIEAGLAPVLVAGHGRPLAGGEPGTGTATCYGPSRHGQTHGRLRPDRISLQRRRGVGCQASTTVEPALVLQRATARDQARYPESTVRVVARPAERFQSGIGGFGVTTV